MHKLIMHPKCEMRYTAPSYDTPAIIYAPAPKYWNNIEQLHGIRSFTIPQIEGRWITIHTDGQFIWSTEDDRKASGLEG